MRNCYVYKCDWHHKDDPKRTMFNVPKDPQKFEEWRQALPKHRPLRPHDRVCEKHFKSTDIQRDWTYNIEGKTKKLMRTKPILKPDAIPCIFNVTNPDAETVATVKRRRKKSPERSEEDVIVMVESTSQQLEDSADREQSVVILIEANESMDVNKQDAEVTSSETNMVPLQKTEMHATERESIFEDLYDNIFEVELPSTVWGIHREPDRQFVAFSRFDWCQKDGNVARSVSLLIDCTLECRAWYDGKLVFENDLAMRLASSESSDEGNLAQLNATIVELLDCLEQCAGKEKMIGVKNVTERLEMSLRSSSMEKSRAKFSANDEAADGEKGSSKNE